MATVEELQAQLDTLTAEKAASDKDAEKWKALSRKNEDDKKANAEKAKLSDELQAKLDATEKAKLSETDQLKASIADLTAQMAEGETARKAADLAALRVRIGAEKKLPAKFIDRLRGEDEESIAADADELLTDMPGRKTNHVSREGRVTEPSKNDDAAFAAELFGGKD